ELVDPEDVAFESDDPEPYQPAPEPEPEPPPAPRVEARPFVRPEPPVPPVQAEAPPYSPPPRPGPSVGRASPMPDPTLSRDMAEELLEPATNAAVKHNFARLSGLSMANSGVTLDALMREMLRPMLKEWLDENLPAVVERMVE